jgi:hypothetical protein
MAKATSGDVFGHAISHHRKQQVSKYKSGGSLMTSLILAAFRQTKRASVKETLNVYKVA